jgi:hypothetical protein
MDAYTTSLKRSALALGETKEAALYFESVIPFFVAYEAIGDAARLQLSDWSAFNTALQELQPNTNELVRSLLPRGLLESSNFVDGWQRLDVLGALVRFRPLLDRYEIPFEEVPLKEYSVTPADYADPEGAFTLEFSALARRFRFFGLPVIAPHSFSHAEDSTGDLVIAIRGLNLVDSSKLAWDQVAAFRKDTDARHKLRRLRMFALKSYDGKSAAFIEDDLLMRMDEYDETVRRWGFATTYATLATLLSSRSLGVALGAAFVSLLAGAPSLAAFCAGGGAAVELGQLVLEISRRRFEFRGVLSDNPVSYLAEIRNRLA